MASSLSRLVVMRAVAGPLVVQRRYYLSHHGRRLSALFPHSFPATASSSIRLYNTARSSCFLATNTTTPPSTRPFQFRFPQQQQQQHQQQQQRRHYLYLPSDWSELVYRWKLYWHDETKTPTKIKIRLQDRYRSGKIKFKDRYQSEKLKFKDRYYLEKLKFKDRYHLQKAKLNDRYHVQKATLQSRYRLEKDQFRQRYQERKLKYRIQATAYYQRRQVDFSAVKARMQQRRREFTKRWSARRRDLLKDSSDMVKGYFATAKQQRRRALPSAQWHSFTITEYCQPHWFDPTDGRPLTSRDPTGRFVNPWMSWSTNGVHSASSILLWRYQRAVRQWKERGIWSFLPKDMSQLLFGRAIAKKSATETMTRLPFVGDPTCTTSTSGTCSDDLQSTAWHMSSGDAVSAAENLGTPMQQHSPPPSPPDIQLTWIGHSTCLVQMGNATILTDPIFSHRCTPFPRLPGVGVARDVPPSMALDDLPPHIDVCMISHDHYDHLDFLTIANLRDRVHHWVLPKGLPEWMETRCSIDPKQMIELEWWESVHMVRHPLLVMSTNHNNVLKLDRGRDAIVSSSFASPATTTTSTWQVVQTLPQHIHGGDDQNLNIADTMTITCCPAQHWSSRTFFDRCKRLWCSFAVETQTQWPPVNDIDQQQQQQHAQEPVVQKFFFTGDSGMPRNGFPLFQQIGDYCGRGMYHHQQQTSVSQTQHRQQDKKNETVDSNSDDAMAAADSPNMATTGSTTTNTTTTPPFAAKFHPFDLAAIPIGAYDPSFLMQDAHMNPSEAVECSRQLQARKSVAIHWGTFALSEEPMDEPPVKLQEALRWPENAHADFTALPIGGSIRVSSILPENVNNAASGIASSSDNEEEEESWQNPEAQNVDKYA